VSVIDTVRFATHADVDRLAAIWHEGWHDAHAGLLPPELTRMRTVESFRERVHEVVKDTRVVGPAGAPVGFCMLKGDELYQLYVARDTRGTGIAGALVADGESRLAAAGVEVAWLACAVGNDRAARFYEKSGWTRTGTVEYQPDASPGIGPLQVWRYEKRLAGEG
jgi:ribosomal protein S18 acetylase RimI-like enzyme